MKKKVLSKSGNKLLDGDEMSDELLFTELRGSLSVDWGGHGFGFGGFVIKADQKGRVIIDDECMGREFLIRVMTHIINQSIDSTLYNRLYEQELIGYSYHVEQSILIFKFKFCDVIFLKVPLELVNQLKEAKSPQEFAVDNLAKTFQYDYDATEGRTKTKERYLTDQGGTDKPTRMPFK